MVPGSASAVKERRNDGWYGYGPCTAALYFLRVAGVWVGATGQFKQAGTHQAFATGLLRQEDCAPSVLQKHLVPGVAVLSSFVARGDLVAEHLHEAPQHVQRQLLPRR